MTTFYAKCSAVQFLCQVEKGGFDYNLTIFTSTSTSCIDDYLARLGIWAMAEVLVNFLCL